MWILPKQLHTLASVQGTEALNLDLNESSQLCAQSLFVRSKPSPLRTWLQKWKRDSWTQHLYGRILKPSLGKVFETELTSLLVVIPASHSVQQASEPAKTTRDTYGPGSQMELSLCAPESASLRTSKDTSRWDSPASSAIWKKWVTECRGAYLARLNAVRLTNANECLSWPTAKARDWKDTTGCSLDAVNPDGTHRNRRDRLVGAIAAEMSGPAAPVNHSTHGSRPESWLTPRANEPTGDSNFVTRNADRGEHCHGSLTQQMKSWATPKASDPQHSGPNMRDSAGNYALPAQAVRESWATPCSRDHHPNGQAAGSKTDLANQAAAWATPRCSMAQDKQEDSGKRRLGEQAQHGTTGKLNPRWVETLMGLPVGWTMPSCASPVTIVPTSCDY